MMTASSRALARIHAVAAEYDISHGLGGTLGLVVPPKRIGVDACPALSRALFDDRVLRSEFVSSFADTRAMSNGAWSVSAQHVLAPSHWFKMCRIYAVAIPAQMVKFETFWDRPALAFVVDPVRQLVSPLIPQPPVSVITRRELPSPARRCVSAILHNILDGREATLVARDVADGLSLDVAPVGSMLRGDRRSFSATTHAKTGRIRPLVSILIVHSDRLLERLIGVPRLGGLPSRRGISRASIIPNSAPLWGFQGVTA